MVAASLVLDPRFIALSARSPRTPTPAITIARGIENWYGSSGKNQNVESAANAVAATSPPISPSQVLPGEIVGESLCLPNARPAKYAPVSEPISTKKKNPRRCVERFG